MFVEKCQRNLHFNLIVVDRSKLISNLINYFRNTISKEID